MVTITFNKEFKDRAELDEYVRTRIGTNADANIAHEIQGSKEELAALALSEKDTVHGVRIVVAEENV